MIPELTKIRIALANLETQLSESLDKAQEIYKQYQLLQPAYNAICIERDNLKKENESLKTEINKLKENGKHNIDNQKS